MLRTLGTFGLGIIFVSISPALRVSIMSDVEAVQRAIVNYSPFSYVGIALAIVGLLMFGLYRSAQPRT